MKKLLSRLEDFKQYQVSKFIKARPKNQGRNGDCVNDATNWGLFPWNAIKAHLLEEVEEFKEADDASMRITETYDGVEAIKNELADIANLAFILWAKMEYED